MEWDIHKVLESAVTGKKHEKNKAAQKAAIMEEGGNPR